MAVGDKLGQQTVIDLNQFVHSWLDDARRSVSDLLTALNGHRIRIKGDFVIEVEERGEPDQHE